MHALNTLHWAIVHDDCMAGGQVGEGRPRLARHQAQARAERDTVEHRLRHGATSCFLEPAVCRAPALNRPEKRNALNTELLTALAMRSTSSRPTRFNAIVLTGAGDKAFLCGHGLADSLQWLGDNTVAGNRADTGRPPRPQIVSWTTRSPLVAALNERPSRGSRSYVVGDLVVAAEHGIRVGRG